MKKEVIEKVRELIETHIENNDETRKKVEISIIVKNEIMCFVESRSIIKKAFFTELIKMNLRFFVMANNGYAGFITIVIYDEI